MDLSLAIAPEHEDAVVSDASLASPMSKHQRQLSLSAKWASNKALAFEYLKRQREVILWMEHILGSKLPSTDLHESLKSGIVLRELLEKLFPDTAQCLSPISRNYSSRMAPWKERENISVFLKQCKVLGMNDLSLFCTDDLYDGNNMVQVMFCVQDFMRFSQDHSGHFLHPVFDDHVTFSNQEVEMALSKIEKAGVDATKLKEMMSSSGSSAPSPERKDKSGSEDYDTDADSLLAPSDAERDADDSEEKALDELEEELQTLANGDARDCSQFGDAHCTDGSDVDEDDNDDLEPEFDDDDDGCEPDEDEYDASDVENEDDDDDVFGDDEEEITSLLSDLVSAVEDMHLTEKEEVACLSPLPVNDDDDAVLGDEEELKDSAQAKQLALNLEEAQRVELPRTPIVSEIVETEVLVSISTKHRIESEARTELMDIGKSDTTMLADRGAARSGDAHSDDIDGAAGSLDDLASKKPKSKGSKTKRKKSRELSDEQLDVEAMSRCTCGSKCSIM